MLKDIMESVGLKYNHKLAKINDDIAKVLGLQKDENSRQQNEQADEICSYLQ